MDDILIPNKKYIATIIHFDKVDAAGDCFTNIHPLAKDILIPEYNLEEKYAQMHKANMFNDEEDDSLEVEAED